MFEKHQINIINEENFPVFNTKAYCLAKEGKFEEAHVIIDKVLEIADEDNMKKSNFIHSVYKRQMKLKVNGVKLYLIS